MILFLSRVVLADDAIVLIEKSTVRLTGKITDDTPAILFTKIKRHQIKTLIVNSGGGETRAAMEIGTWMNDHQVNIEVDEKCFSSCANYLFTAASHKTIRPGALVAWHGDLTQQQLDDTSLLSAITVSLGHNTNVNKEKILAQFKQYVSDGQQQQKVFFDKIGVDPRICSVGHEYGAEDFFILSVEDMNTFGIKNIHAPENYNHQDLSKFNNIRPFSYVKIKK